METKELLQQIIDVAIEFQAETIRVLEVSELCGFADYFVIMTGRSTTQNQAIAEKIIFQTKHAGQPANGTEGLVRGEWILLDFGDIIVHIFKEEMRQFYELEKLWSGATVVYPPKIQGEPATV